MEGLDRVGVRRVAGPADRRTQRRGAEALAVEHAFGVVFVGGDLEALFPRQGEEPEHVAAGEGADEERLGVRFGLVAAELERRGAGQRLGAEQDAVGADVLALAPFPGDAGSVDRLRHAYASPLLCTPRSSRASATVAAR